MSMPRTSRASPKADPHTITLRFGRDAQDQALYRAIAAHAEKRCQLHPRHVLELLGHIYGTITLPYTDWATLPFVNAFAGPNARKCLALKGSIQFLRSQIQQGRQSLKEARQQLQAARALVRQERGKGKSAPAHPRRGVLRAV